MKCIKVLSWLYCAIIAVAVVTLIACSRSKSIEYIFDISQPDYSSELSADSINYLFDRGVTVKTYKGHNYYIHNAYEHIDSIGNNEVLDFGPVTFEERFDRANYKLNRVKTGDITKCLLELPLISKFEGELVRVELEPAWLKFSMYDGLFNVNILPSITFNFAEKLKKGDKFLVDIPWNMVHADPNMPILVSIKVNCYITDEEYFAEVINLNFRNSNM
jgi:hypothetical protein